MKKPNIHEQVISLEQAKDLTQAGIEMDSMFRWIEDTHFKMSDIILWRNVPRPPSNHQQEYPAFTVAELITKLPKTLEADDREYWFTIKAGNDWIVYYSNEPDNPYHINLECEEKLIDVLVKMLLWVQSRGN